jgi:hypothetical protein
MTTNGKKLKRIKHLKEMTMRAEAARAGKRFKHAVTALSVMSYESGQKHFYKTLAAMTDGQLLAALEAGSIELSISSDTSASAESARAEAARAAASQPVPGHEREKSRGPASTAHSPVQPTEEGSSPAPSGPV